VNWAACGASLLLQTLGATSASELKVWGLAEIPVFIGPNSNRGLRNACIADLLNHTLGGLREEQQALRTAMNSGD